MSEALASVVILVVKIVVFFYDVVTYPVYYIIQRPGSTLATSNESKAAVIYKSTKRLVLRNLKPLTGLQLDLLQNNIETMPQLYDLARFKHGNKDFLGTRKIFHEEEETQPDGRQFQKYVMGDYKWLTHKQVYLMAMKIGKGLRELGLEPKSRVIIFAETRAEWFMSLLGCFLQNITVVTMYANLGEEGVTHGILESEATHIITSYDLLPIVRSLNERHSVLRCIIYMESRINPRKVPEKFPGNVRVYQLAEVMELGSLSKLALESPDKDDVAVIMYTSGSTGTPKGVQMLHFNMVSAVLAYVHVVGPTKTDVYVSFLPLAHSLELIAECWCLLHGIPIGYSTPLTLTDKSSKIKRGTKGDLSLLRPTIFTAVPLILDRIYKDSMDAVTKQSPLMKNLFYFAFNYKKKWLSSGYDTPVMNMLVFNKMRKMIGGRIRVIASGGAPLSPDTHEFLRILFCVPVIQAYGLTESCATGTSMSLNDLNNGRVGAPFPPVDIQLINWEGGSYSVMDRPNPRGEVVLGGNMIAAGYFKLDNKTNEDFFEENGKRWFKTGDIGEIEPDGVLKIIDRKKDLVKLSLGEYVSLGKVESLLKTCPVIESICIIADPSTDHTVALVVPDIPHLMTIGANLNSDETYEELCRNPEVERIVALQIQNYGKKVKLQKFEIPAVVKLCGEHWTPETGLVTAAFKLKRKNLENYYKSDIDTMYGRPREG